MWMTGIRRRRRRRLYLSPLPSPCIPRLARNGVTAAPPPSGPAALKKAPLLGAGCQSESHFIPLLDTFPISFFLSFYGSFFDFCSPSSIFLPLASRSLHTCRQYFNCSPSLPPFLPWALREGGNVRAWKQFGKEGGEGEGVDQKELRFDGGAGSSSRDFTPGKAREESRPRETAISILYRGRGRANVSHRSKSGFM